MPFNIQHGRVEDIAHLAAKAGAAEQTIRNHAEDADMQKMILQNTFQKDSQLRAIQHDIAMQQHKEDIQFEAAKAQQTWELEKEMLRSQQNFTIQLQQEGIAKQQTAQKMAAIQSALDEGQITESDANALRMKVQTGLFAPSTMQSMRQSPNSMDALVQQLTGGPMETAPTLETRKISDQDLPSTVTMSDGTVKKYIDGEMVTTSTPDTVQQQAVEQKSNYESLVSTASQEPYTKTGTWPFSKKTPNIPVMRANLTLAMSSEELSPREQIEIQQIVSSGNPEAIEAYYKMAKKLGITQTPLTEQDDREVQSIQHQMMSNPLGN